MHRLVAHGDWAQADVLLTKGLACAGMPPAAVPLAVHVKLQLDRQREARELALTFASACVDQPALLLQGARLMRTFEEPEALQCLMERVDWQKIDALPLLAELTLILGSAALFAPARACVERMLKIAPAYADAHYLDGLLEMFRGQHERSLAALDRALRIEPRMANAHWLVAMQGGRETAATHVQMMLRALPGVAPGTEAAGYMYYALHQRLHSLGRYADAWDALRRGHAVLRPIRNYRRDSQRRIFEALKSLDLPPGRFSPPAADTPGLIFIVGMFRSGTTLVERLLAGHPDVMDGGETYQFSAGMRDATNHYCVDVLDATIIARAPRADFERVRARMRAYARWGSEGRRWLTEKLPSNFLNVGFILHALPEAKVIHLRRDPVDTCFSNLRTIFQGNAAYACDQEDLADYFLRYHDLMDHWHARAPGRILDVDYAALVDDPDNQARRIFEYCGLDHAAQALDIGRAGGHAATASAVQVRQGFLKNRAGAWTPYRPYLQPLLRRLGCD